jgi:hypothetical protein
MSKLKKDHAEYNENATQKSLAFISYFAAGGLHMVTVLDPVFNFPS